MSEAIYLTNVRLSFPAIATPKAFEAGGKEIFGADFIMPSDHPGFAAFMKSVNETAAEKWKELTPQVMAMINADRKLRSYSQGAERISKTTMKVLDGYEGMVAITAKKDRRPQLINADGSPVDPENTMQVQTVARKLYGGCYVNAVVKPWAQDNKYGKGMRCDFVAIQFLRDGDAFGEGNTDASGMFGAVASQIATADTAPPWGGGPAFGDPAAATPPWMK